MDRIEVARQIAAALHAKAVAAGDDPWQPVAFALAEATRRGIDVEPTVPGATLLDGGRAIFRPADDMILYEDKGSAFDKAFLIAHELGHAVLGDADGAPAKSVDPARPAEPTPVGIDRIVDYGRRQRREVQMDLFAREFLLPREVLRQLHVDKGMTASAISAKAGAPLDVVAQQLFDALLLPPVTKNDERLQAKKPLNQLQEAAAEHRGCAYLLEAGPGTGKTQTLVARVESLLRDGVDPRQILPLTFSNKAAREMSERIAVVDKDAAAAMWIGTFHAFGLDIIHRFHDRLGLPANPRMMDRTEAAELVEEEFPRLGLTQYRDVYDPTSKIVDILAAISRAKDEVVDHDDYAALAQAMSRDTPEGIVAGEKAAEVAKVYGAYEALKCERQCVDFGDLVLRPVQLLESDGAVAQELRERYQHVLVDEYQDVNRSSVRLLTALRPDGENLWVVGDARQSIYRFRGASSFNMSRFGNEDFAGAKSGRLRRNYRSVKQITDAFSSFASEMKVGGEDATLEADRGEGTHQPAVVTVDQADQEIVLLADTIEEMRRAGHAYRDQAVLSTGNDKLARLGTRLERLGIPVLFLGSLFERPEIKELLALLSTLIDRRAMGLVRTACRPEFEMPLGDIGVVLAHLRDHAERAGHWQKGLAKVEGLSREGQAGLSALADALAGFDETSSPWDVLAALLLDRTRIAAQIATSASIQDRAHGIAIWQFMNFVRAQPKDRGLPILRLLDRIRRLIRLRDDGDLRQIPEAAQSIDAVRLMTIHGAKGLEFEVVHVPGLNKDTIPRVGTPPACAPPDGMIAGATGSADDQFKAAQAQEHECLFYVALSRACDRLFLSAPIKTVNGRRRDPSPFLGRLGPGIDRRHVRPERACPAAPEDADISLISEGPLRFSAFQLALYETCPRRFFYTHVLEIGGRRRMTPFMRMHEAIRGLVEGILSGEVVLEAAADLKVKVDAALATQKLDEHGYADDYRALALAMVQYFVDSRRSLTQEAPQAMVLTFDDAEVTVRADDVLVRPGGGRILRRIRTGHMRSTEGKDVGAAAFLLAARRAFPDAEVEFLHLADQETRPIPLADRELTSRRGKLGDFLADVRRGRFPAKPSAYTCPSCPAFFICGPTPSGDLQKKF